MYTATRDLVLPTTVTGSWPRPSWYTLGLDRRPLSTAMNDLAFREQFTDALDTVIADQERAGLDILTNGDYHQDPDLGGRSWVLYPVERLAGISDVDPAAPDAWTYPPGTILNEVMGGWRYPAIDGPIGPGTPLEYGKIWRLAQGRTEKPVKIGTVSAQVAVMCTPVRTDHYAGDKHQAMWDMATAFNAELRALAAAGCTVIQVEEPMLHGAAQTADPGEVEFLIECFNHEISGLEDVEVWAHTCWGNPNMQKVSEQTSYERSAELYLERTNVDVWTLEYKGDDPEATLRLFDRYGGTPPKKIALGLVDHRTVQVESPEEVAADVRRAMEHIDPEHLVLSTNCGFGRGGSNRLVAFYKATALAQGANIVRRELGLPETRVRAADPELQSDVPALTLR
jgi:5-methyltetrahydropteroyltriglutamate--homocysteine methyltransferase